MESPIGRGRGGRHVRHAAFDLEATGAAALAFLAADPETLGDFLAVTGLDAETIRTAAGQAGFMRGVLTYLASDETLFVQFARSHDLDPERLGLEIARLDHASDGT